MKPLAEFAKRTPEASGTESGADIRELLCRRRRSDAFRPTWRSFIHGLFGLSLLFGAGAQATADSNASRNIQFSRVTQWEGLSQGAVNAIVQDGQGYIWLGTQEGLNRYDGYEMVVFEHRNGDPGSLSHDWVWSLLVDKQGELWVGTDGGGLSRFDREREAFVNYRHSPNNPNSLPSDRVRVIFQDNAGDFWVGTDGGGLSRYSPSHGGFVSFRHDPADPSSLPSNVVLAVYEDSRGKLWVGTDKGLARMDMARKKFEVFRHQPGLEGSLSNDHVRVIYEDRRERLWVGTYEGGLNLLDRSSGKFHVFRHDPKDADSLSHDRVRDVYQDHQGTLWVATDDGLDEWRPQTGGFAHYKHDPTQPSSLSDSRLTTLFQDSGEVLWVGSFNGANKWNYLSDSFHYLRVGSDGGLSGNVITALDESADGSVWVGSYGGGLDRVPFLDGEVQHFGKSASEDGVGLNDARVMAVQIADDGRVWVGTRNGGVNVIQPADGSVTYLRHEPNNDNSLSSDAVTSILKDSTGMLWVGTYGAGLNRVDPYTGEVRRYRHLAGDSGSLSSDRILSVYEDSTGKLWVGTENGGLNSLDPRTGLFTRYRHDPKNRASLASDAAWNIMEGSDGSLWVSTLGGGLNRWTLADRERGKVVFKHYDKSNVLKSDTVFASVEDQDGQVWLSTNRGLSRLDPEREFVRHFDRFNGLRGDEFNFGAYLKTASGNLLFGGTDGLVRFDPQQLRVNMHKPQVVLSAHFKYRRLANTDSRADEKPQTLQLSYKDDYISFRFTGLDFASSDKNSYAYKLEGFDKEWQDPGEVRTATYTSLPAGEYLFTVKAANNDGVWNEDGASFRLIVEPPPWQSPWAYSLYTLFLGGTVVNYRRNQNRKLERAAKENAKLEREVQARTKALSERNEELRAANEKLREATFTDPLTGLRNRRYLYDTVEDRLAAVARRFDDTQPGVIQANMLNMAPTMFFMMIDLDGFKAINDTFGHAAGDQALMQVTEILRKHCRKSDTVIRWGGDEFMIVGDNSSLRAAEQLAERIRKHLAEHLYQLGGGNIGRLSGSIGFAMYPFSPLKKANLLTWEQVVAIADHAAYTAKKNGRNAWVGVYGTRKSTWEEFSKTDINVVALAEQGMLSLRTSLEKVVAPEPESKKNESER
ncbi:MAG: diguanylate cyclase [Chromatiales bacterium]|nr:diguanylate cyclase [Chromatiales bacterium]